MAIFFPKGAKRAIFLLLAVLVLIQAFPGCTNYSSEEKRVNPPILLGIQADGTGYLLTVAVQNTEIGFEGYRLYQGLSETEVRNKNDSEGVDCSVPLQAVPARAIPYTIEVKPDQIGPTAGSDSLCNVPLTLVPGTVIALRSLIFENYFSSATSMSSNALIVP